ncbi:hypothetical protein PROFUN_10805 [Planoprotostelium fungivorum]|uniref:Uncharacterized protein n=1 Tax=Planoprotostelium fungivorum TaxID=1890364 RepID=A0A2P6NCX6_9EUKA|nr:hypothetical protein PROFUN_10805 [Planoprotostelium fungivorum]
MTTLLSRFDFICFDWKGTLEGKGGNKHAREQKALDTVKKEISPLGHDPIMFENIYRQKKREQKEREEKTHATFTVKELLESVLDAAHISSDITRNRVINTFIRQYMSLENSNATKMLPGWKKILRLIQNNNVPLCLLRNSTLTGPEFQKKIDSVGAGEFFTWDTNIILSGETGFQKPHPSVFRAAVQKCFPDGEEPSRVLFIGNETEADVIGSNNMGWTSVLIRTTEKSSNGKADYEIDNLMELKDIIFMEDDSSEYTSDDSSDWNSSEDDE